MEVKLFFQSYSFINYIILIYCGLTIPIMHKNIPEKLFLCEVLLELQLGSKRSFLIMDNFRNLNYQLFCIIWQCIIHKNLHHFLWHIKFIVSLRIQPVSVWACHDGDNTQCKQVHLSSWQKDEWNNVIYKYNTSCILYKNKYYKNNVLNEKIVVADTIYVGAIYTVKVLDRFNWARITRFIKIYIR